MSHIDEQGRPEPPFAADEPTMLKAYLDWQRATLRWKCSGLDSAGMSTKVAASKLTLGGILKHMALVEDAWFSWSLWGEDRHKHWPTVDWGDPDWEFDSAADDTPDELFAMWDAAIARSDDRIARAMSAEGLDKLSTSRSPDGESPTLRWIMVHMIEEYARHNGHADLIREAVDGEVGE